jgi:hypothetical protein
MSTRRPVLFGAEFLATARVRVWFASSDDGEQGDKDRPRENEVDRVARIAADLDSFHRGRGIHADDFATRVGPHLAQVVFADSNPEPTYGRDLLKRWFLAASQELPPDLRAVFLAASGMTQPGPRLTDRLGALSRSTGLANRTLVRRLRQADALVAAKLDALSYVSEDDNPFARRGWYVERLESTAYLDEERPRFVGVREVLCTIDGLEQICESLSVPRPPGDTSPVDLIVAATEGCEVDSLTRVSPSTWQVALGLPRPLAVGERHRLGVSIAMPSRAFVKPYNAFVPVRRTRSFAAVVHLPTDGSVTGAWRLDGVPPAAMEDGVPIGDSFDLPASEPLAAEWTTVRRGLGYGIGWSW